MVWGNWQPRLGLCWTGTGSRLFKIVNLSFQIFCDKCDVGLSSKSHLKRHLQSKHGGKLFKCDICDAAFARSDHLKNHVEGKHSKEKKFGCHICHAKFASR